MALEDNMLNSVSLVAAVSKHKAQLLGANRPTKASVQRIGHVKPSLL